MGVATLRSYEVAGIPEDFTIEPLNCMSDTDSADNVRPSSRASKNSSGDRAKDDIGGEVTSVNAPLCLVFGRRAR